MHSRRVTGTGLWIHQAADKAWRSRLKLRIETPATSEQQDDQVRKHLCFDYSQGRVCPLDEFDESQEYTKLILAYGSRYMDPG